MTTEALQTFFTRGYLGLASQGFKRSTRSLDTTIASFCMYRGPGNRKCFVGHNIDDAEYKPVMDEAIYSHGDFQAHGMFLDIPLDDFVELQRIHDDARSSAEIKLLYQLYAERRGLHLPTTTTGG